MRGRGAAFSERFLIAGDGYRSYDWRVSGSSLKVIMNRLTSGTKCGNPRTSQHSFAHIIHVASEASKQRLYSTGLK